MARRERRKDRRVGRQAPVQVEDFEWVDTRSMPIVRPADEQPDEQPAGARPEPVPAPAPPAPLSQPAPAPRVEPSAAVADDVSAETAEASAAAAVDVPAVEPGRRRAGERSRRLVADRVRARARTAGGAQVKRARRARARAHEAVSPAFGDLLAAGCALALLVCMFAMAWYGVAGVPDPSYARPAVATTADGWNGLPTVRWVILATVLAAVGSLGLHLSQRRHGARTDTARIVAALGALTAGLLVWRVLITLPGNGKVLDQKLGALLGLACALGIAWGGAEMVMQGRRDAAAGASLGGTLRDEAPAPEPGRPSAVAGRGPTKEGPK